MGNELMELNIQSLIKYILKGFRCASKKPAEDFEL